MVGKLKRIKTVFVDKKKTISCCEDSCEKILFLSKWCTKTSQPVFVMMMTIVSILKVNINDIVHLDEALKLILIIFEQTWIVNIMNKSIVEIFMNRMLDSLVTKSTGFTKIEKLHRKSYAFSLVVRVIS